MTNSHIELLGGILGGVIGSGAGVSVANAMKVSGGWKRATIIVVGISAFAYIGATQFVSNKPATTTKPIA